MHLVYLAARDFRSYEAAEVSLEPGVNTFVGPNGQGKTNLLEAAGYLATLGSHRAAADAPLVRHGAERAILRAEIRNAGRTALVEMEINPGKTNRARINRAPVQRFRDVLGTLRVVLFAPEDLALIKGDPAERRRFLDELLAARAPRYAGVRADYERVLKQRNALLKSAAAAHRGRGSDVPSTLDVWDAHLARTGAELLAARLELVAALQPLVDKAYQSIAGVSGPVGLDYRSSLGPDVELVPDSSALAAAMQRGLADARQAELERGVSLVGPHRDDVVIRIDALPSRGYASQGESWSLALGLRLAAYGLLRGDGTEPVLLLDDVFAELDDERRTRLAEMVAPGEQVLITAAVPDDVPGILTGARYEVSNGRVERVR